MALVLIVDDDTQIVAMLSEVVTDSGHTVISATNGVEALAQARAQLPALIISDVMMPVLDGYGLLQAVRGAPELQQTPIFLMSAAFTSPDMSVAAPADGYVRKPFDLCVIERILAQIPS